MNEPKASESDLSAEFSAVEALDWLEDESCDLRCCSGPIADTGDHDIWWEVHKHYSGGKTRVVGRGSTTLAAVFDATLEPGDVRRSDYVPPHAENGPRQARRVSGVALDADVGQDGGE